MAETETKPTDVTLPELVISDSMRAAAMSVAATFHAYQEACYSLATAKGEAAILHVIKAQKESKQAYHLALKFLSTAGLKANPSYDASANEALDEAARSQLQPLFDEYLDKRLNTLVKEQAGKASNIVHVATDHPVMKGPW